MHLNTSICKPRRSQHIKSIQKDFTIDAYCLLYKHHLAFTVRVTLATVSQSTQTALCLQYVGWHGEGGLCHTQPCLIEVWQMMGWPLVLREEPVSQRGCCRVHHLAAITNCWHIVRGWSWGEKNSGVSLARVFLFFFPLFHRIMENGNGRSWAFVMSKMSLYMFMSSSQLKGQLTPKSIKTCFPHTCSAIYPFIMFWVAAFWRYRL